MLEWVSSGHLRRCERAELWEIRPREIRAIQPSRVPFPRLCSSAVKANRSGAWTRLADLYGPVVYRWCRQAGVTRDDAPDVVQEVFAALALHIDGFRREKPGDSFAAWLRTITQNKIRDHFRSRHGRPAAEGGSEAQQRIEQLAEPSEPSAASNPREVQEMVLPIGLDLVRAEFEPRTWEAFRRVAIQKAAAGPGRQRVGDEHSGRLPSQVAGLAEAPPGSRRRGGID